MLVFLHRVNHKGRAHGVIIGVGILSSWIAFNAPFYTIAPRPAPPSFSLQVKQRAGRGNDSL